VFLKKALHGEKLCFELRPPFNKIFSIKPANNKVQPITDEGAGKAKEQRIRSFKQSAMDQR